MVKPVSARGKRAMSRRRRFQHERHPPIVEGSVSGRAKRGLFRLGNGTSTWTEGRSLRRRGATFRSCLCVPVETLARRSTPRRESCACADDDERPAKRRAGRQGGRRRAPEAPLALPCLERAGCLVAVRRAVFAASVARPHEHWPPGVLQCATPAIPMPRWYEWRWLWRVGSHPDCRGQLGTGQLWRPVYGEEAVPECPVWLLWLLLRRERSTGVCSLAARRAWSRFSW